MHDVDPEVDGSRDPEERVHVRPIHVEKRACAVQQLGYLQDPRLEDPERVGIREHHGRDRVVDLRAQILDVHPPVETRAHLPHFESRDRAA